MHAKSTKPVRELAAVGDCTEVPWVRKVGDASIRKLSAYEIFWIYSIAYSVFLVYNELYCFWLGFIQEDSNVGNFVLVDPFCAQTLGGISLDTVFFCVHRTKCTLLGGILDGKTVLVIEVQVLRLVVVMESQ